MGRFLGGGGEARGEGAGRARSWPGGERGVSLLGRAEMYVRRAAEIKE